MSMPVKFGGGRLVSDFTMPRLRDFLPSGHIEELTNILAEQCLEYLGESPLGIPQEIRGSRSAEGLGGTHTHSLSDLSPMGKGSISILDPYPDSGSHLVDAQHKEGVRVACGLRWWPSV